MKEYKLIDRTISTTMIEMFRYFPIVTLTGPRQSGKTTLCCELFNELPYVNLEESSTLTEIQEDPNAFISKHKNGVIIDEAQNYPEIFSLLQVQVDKDRLSGNPIRHRYIVTGSNNLSLMENITQSMAGRSAVMSLLPLSLKEILSVRPRATTNELILNGGYPSIWNADSRGREILLENYYTTYIERDVRRLINLKDLHAFRRFVRLCAGRIGCEFNASSLAVEVGVKAPTIQHWLSVLEASYIIYTLPPFFANIKKRLIKSPKIYFYDTGLATHLLGISDSEQLSSHPLRGQLFENMAINETLKHGFNKGKNEDIYFYRDQSQREIDLIRIRPEGIEAYEIKSGQTYNSEYFKNLDYLKKLLGEQLLRTMVVYDGDSENCDVSYHGFCNIRSMHDCL